MKVTEKTIFRSLEPRFTYFDLEPLKSRGGEARGPCPVGQALYEFMARPGIELSRSKPTHWAASETQLGHSKHHLFHVQEEPSILGSNVKVKILRTQLQFMCEMLQHYRDLTMTKNSKTCAAEVKDIHGKMAMVSLCLLKGSIHVLQMG